MKLNPIAPLLSALRHLALLPEILRELTAIRRGLELQLQQQYHGGISLLDQADIQLRARAYAEQFAAHRPYTPEDIPPPSDYEEIAKQEFLRELGDDTEEMLAELDAAFPEIAADLRRIHTAQQQRRDPNYGSR